MCTDAETDPETGECLEPTDYEADEALCDDLDNDCDGFTDNLFCCQTVSVWARACPRKRSRLPMLPQTRLHEIEWIFRASSG